MQFQFVELFIAPINFERGCLRKIKGEFSLFDFIMAINEEKRTRNVAVDYSNLIFWYR